VPTAELCTGGLRVLRGIELYNDEVHSSKQQDDIALQAQVASIVSKCFSCFIGIL
jgi:hypothetical protein